MKWKWNIDEDQDHFLEGEGLMGTYRVSLLENGFAAATYQANEQPLIRENARIELGNVIKYCEKLEQDRAPDAVTAPAHDLSENEKRARILILEVLKLLGVEQITVPEKQAAEADTNESPDDLSEIF